MKNKVSTVGGEEARREMRRGLESGGGAAKQKLWVIKDFENESGRRDGKDGNMGEREHDEQKEETKSKNKKD